MQTHRRRSKFYGNSVAAKNPTFAYAIIIFIDRTSTYTITFTHHREGGLGFRVSPKVSLVIRVIAKNIYRRRSNFLAFLAVFTTQKENINIFGLQLIPALPS